MLTLKPIVLLLSLSIFFSCNNTASTIEQGEEEIAIKEDTTKRKEISNDFSIDYLTGHFDPAKHADFVKAEAQYTDGEQTYYLHNKTWAAFQKMANAAQKDGVKLILRSATRNFNRQKQIWEGKWTGSRRIEGGVNAAKKYPDPKTRALKILLYSSMPGTSRHHWGTDIDLNNFNNSYFEKGEGLKIYTWLQLNAATYGFCQPYTKKGEKRPNGYEEERWHWSYLPLATKLTQIAQKSLDDKMISGFKGAETAMQIGVVKKYVLGVNTACLSD